MAGKPITIRRKLISAIMGTSLTVLALTCTVFIMYEFVTLRNGMARGLITRGELIAANSTAALAFQNEADATQVLSALKTDPRMVAGCLYDKDGRLFAKYPADAPAGVFPTLPVERGYRFEKGHLVVFVPVTREKRRLGTVYLKSDLSALTERFRFYTVFVSVVIAGSIVVTYALSARLQRRISEPILNLASTARSVSEHKDYALRAQKQSDDEIGLLTDSFNDMLNEIQQRSASLRKNEARLRAVLESALDCIITIDEEGKILEFNPAAERTFGYSRRDVIGKEMAPLIIPPEMRQQHREGLKKHLLTGEARVLGRRIEMTAVSADGVEFPVELAIIRIETEGPPVFTGFARDITERRRAETTRALLAGIVESSDDAIFSKTLDGVVTSWNAGAERLFGYRAAEMIGRSVTILNPPENTDEEPHILTLLRRGERIDHYETVRVRKDGQRIAVSVSISPLKDADGRITGASNITRDITHLKRAEEEIRRLNAELEQRVVERTAQLEATNKELEAFSYSVSHDLRAPLRGIDGFSRVLEEDFAGKLDETGRSHLQRVRAAAQRMGALIDDMLMLSQVTRKEMRRELVDLSALAESIAAELRKAEPERHAEFRITPGLAAKGDPVLLRAVLENLLGNAWKFTSKRPEATIEFGRIASNGDDNAYFVRDNGAGFDMAYASKLFGAFQRLHAAAEFRGTGIGLATVQRIVRRHGGRAWAEGAVDKGATFYFTLGSPRDIQTS